MDRRANLVVVRIDLVHFDVSLCVLLLLLLVGRLGSLVRLDCVVFRRRLLGWF